MKGGSRIRGQQFVSEIAEELQGGHGDSGEESGNPGLDYKAFFDNSNDAMYLLKEGGVLVDCNHRTLEMFGCTREQIIGKNPYLFSPGLQPDGKNSRKKAAQIVKEVFEGRARSFEWRHRAYNGIPFDVEVSHTRIGEGSRAVVQAIARDVTLRKQATEALKESRELFRTTLTSIGDAVIVTNTEGQVTFLNAEAERLTGWASREALKQPLATVFTTINETNREPEENIVDKVLHLGRIVGLANPTVLISRDGREIPIDENGAPIRRADGTVQGVVLVFRDFSTRKKAEKAIQESEEKFRILFEKSPDPVLLLDSGRFVDCNEAALKLLRCPSKDRLIGLRPVDVSPETQPDGLPSSDRAQEVIDISSKEGVSRFEWVHRTFDGTDVWIDNSLTSIPVRGRQIQYNVWRDITGKKLAEAALKESRELFRTTLTSIGDAVIVTNTEGQVTFLNAEAERLTGWASREALKQPLATVFTTINETNREPEENIVDKVLHLGRIVGLANPTVLISRDGREIPIDENGAPIRRADGTVQGVVLVFRDFSTRKKAEKAIQESEEKFRILFEKSPDPVLLLDSGRFVDCNEAALKLLRCPSKDRLIGLRPVDVSPETQPDGLPSSDRAQEVIDISSKEGVSRFEWVHRTFDGTDVWIDNSLTSIPVRGRQIQYNVWRDITGKKLAEAALEESREKYRCIYENVAEGMFRADAAGRLISSNTAMARMCGFDRPEDLVESALSPDKVYARPKDPHLLRALLREKGVARNVEAELYTRNGSVRWARMNVRAEKDEKGAIVYYDGTMEDISETKWAEDRYRSIFLNATEGIFQITPEGRCFRANPALARLHGFASPEEFMENATDIGTQLHVNVETWRQYLKEMQENGNVRDCLWKMYKKDRSIVWLSINARVVGNETGQVLYHEGTAQDITEKKLMVDQILMQRDLALRLAQTGDVGKGLELTLKTAIRASGMECGGIWFKRPEGEEFELISSIGLSPKLEKEMSLLAPGSPAWKKIIDKEHILYAIMLPILHDGTVIGSLNLFSRARDTISEQATIGLEFLDRQLGSIIVRIRVQQELEQEIITRGEAEKALRAERRGLEEANIALKVLLGQRQKDREELEQRLASNVSELVLPYVEKLKKARLEGLQRATLGFIETNLKEILSPFLHNLRNFRLTPRQVEIVSLIKQGKTTKEIAEFLNTSKDAIDKQRFIIRKKLGANKDKINLRSLLLSL